METEFEDRLRQSLAARAADVRPDPETWGKVQRRIARGRTYRFAAGAALATAAIAAAAVVGPMLLSGPLRVDLTPAPAEQPDATPTDADGQPSDPSPGIAITPPSGVGTGLLGLVVTDGASIWITDGAGNMLDAVDQDGEYGPIRDLTVRPNDLPGQVTVVWRAGSGCDAELLAAVVTADGITRRPVEHAECPGRPVFSPDGSRLAWIESDAASPSGFGLRVVEWLGEFNTDYPIAVAGPTTLPLSFDAPGYDRPGDVVAVDIEEWIWDAPFEIEEGPPARWRPGRARLFLTASDREAGPLTFHVGFRIDEAGQPEAGSYDFGDGERGEPGIVYPLPAHWLAYASGNWGLGKDPEYIVRAEPSTLEPTWADYVILGRPARDGSELITTALPDGFPAGGSPDLWLSALGDAVLLGDGKGAAWRIEWADEAWSEWTRLPGSIVHADLAVLERESAQATGPDVEPLPAQEGLPHEVEEIRQAIAAAARTGDIDQLVMLTQITDRFHIDFDDQDPHAYFASMKERGELELLARILQFPYGTQEPEGGPTYYVWPYALAVEDFNSLSSAQLQELEALAGPGELAQWEELGEYWGPRMGIEERGAWAFFVRGGD